MRFRSFILLVVVLGGLGWAAWTIAAAGSSYLEASGMVDQVVLEAVKRRKAALATGSTDSATDLVGSVKVGVAAAARRAGLRLDEQATEVLIVPRGVQVSVKWSVPAVNFQGETYLSVPMSFSGTFNIN